jgi:amino acid adenylation domain-containing protein
MTRHPLTETQKGIFFDCQLGESSQYHIAAGVLLWDVNVELFAAAIHKAIGKHEALRSSIELDDDLPVLIVHDAVQFQLDLVDARGSDGRARAIAALDKLTIEPFELNQSPLFRAKLLRISDSEYAFLLCAHHIVSDGWSFVILKRDILSFYESLLAAAEDAPVERQNNFLKFIQRENQKLESGAYQQQKEYWLRKLKDVQPLNLIADLSLQSGAGGHGREQRFNIDSSLYRRLEALCRTEEVTVFMLSVAAFALLLQKYTGSNDLVFGIPVTNRPGADFEEAVGCFVSMLPVRCAVDGEADLAQLLRNVRTTLIELYKNSSYPSNLIIRDSKLATHAGNRSIFDVSFTFDVFDDEHEPGVRTEALEQQTVTFPGSLMFIIARNGQSVQLAVQYNSSLFKSTTIDLMGERFISLLETFAADIHTPAKDVSLLLKGEESRIRNEFNQSEFFPLQQDCLASIFESRAAQFASRTALQSTDRAYTYDEVNRRANQLARRIVALKGKHNQAVGVDLQRSPDLVIAILAILKAGCAYVPIDPNYPQTRKNFITADADISLTLTTRLSAGQTCRDGGVICVDDPDVYTGLDGNLPASASPSDLAYTIYTSGSTGKPKGVMIENQSVVNTLKDLERRFPMEADDAFMLKTAVTFDVSTTEIFGWFMGQGRLFVLEPGGEKDSERMLDVIAQYKITHINFVPAMFRPFLDSLERKRNLGRLQSLKYIFVGGEAVTPDIPRRFFALNTHIRLENVYGPTECSVWASHYFLSRYEEGASVPIGSPLNLTRWYVVDAQNKLQPVGIVGELCLSGIGLARGYLNRPELNSEKFVANPFFVDGMDAPFFRSMFRTGDLARWLPDGTIECLGRIDTQVKVRGVRVELGEIENTLQEYDGVVQAVVLVANQGGMSLLRAYYQAEREIPAFKLKEFVASRLPAYMVPSFFIHTPSLPLTTSGKVDRNALMQNREHARQSRAEYVAPTSELEGAISRIWMEVLRIDKVGVDDNFFDIGGHSLALIQVSNKLARMVGNDVSMVSLFQYPTIRQLARHFQNQDKMCLVDRKELFTKRAAPQASDVAIIGMSIRVPGANSVADFWQNLIESKESIRFYSNDELRAFGVSEALINDPSYVKGKGVLDGIEYFDASFFDYSPREAHVMSPQLRALYQATWDALEDAGYDSSAYPGRIGLFVGGSEEFDWYQRAFVASDSFSNVYQAFTLNTNHFLATRIAYKLNLTGPAYSVVTGCSTSLVTPHVACQALALHECDMAVAGGITIELPNSGGYSYEEGMIFSPDGHCRPFSADAKGTVFSNGLGIVVLKRLEDAVRDGDHVYAVIKGSATNNDGRQKIGYTAPSVEGQATAITEAYQKAGIDPETVSYIEAHGTGTTLGDPIEIEALARAFRSQKKQFCRIGSVKGNTGHTDTAAGIVGLIKVALCLQNRQLPASINCSEPNPQINFDESPFIVNTETRAWDGDLLRAGINSFGIGGTNAHMVLEEAPARGASGAEGANELLVFSARTARSVESTAQRVLAHVAAHPELKLSDVAYTLQVGRKAFAYRKTLVVDRALVADAEKAQAAVASAKTYTAADGQRPVYFLFPGQGSQYAGMGRGLYEAGGVYREAVDRCLAALTESERDTLWSVWSGYGEGEAIHETEHSQLALFILEYALAQMLESLGVVADGMLGHSLGELVAATLAGVFTVEDGVRLVRRRGALMQAQPRGAMVAVLAEEAAVRASLIEGVWLAVVNTSENCIVSGSEERIAAYEGILTAEGTPWRRLKTSHAFHSPLMEEAAEKFAAEVELVPRGPARRPFVSNVSGEWIGEEARSGRYWGEHLRQPVQFAKGLGELLRAPDAVLIEVGPGPSLSGFAQQHGGRQAGQRCMALVRHPKDTSGDMEYLQGKLGRLWSEGVEIDWRAAHAGHLRHRVPLPTYDFEKQLFPVDAPVTVGSQPSQIQIAIAGRSEEVPRIESASDLQTQIILAYRSVLGFDQIGAAENFFELGGDSLKAVSLAAALNKVLHFKVELTELFDNPTPEQLSRSLALKAPQQQTYERLQPVTPRAFYPLSSAQRRMYSLYLLDPANLAYNLPSATIIDGPLNRSRLEAAVHKLIARHETLRTSFHIEDGQPVQKIHGKVAFAIQYKKQVVNSDLDIDKLLHRFVTPFDLTIAPLFRVELVEIGADRSLLLFDVHHIVADGTSVELLTKDVSRLYVEDLESLPIQYKDFAVWQNEFLQSDNVKAQQAVWMDQFSGGTPMIDLPTDYARPSVKSFEGDNLRFSIDEDLSAAVMELARSRGTTLFMTLLAAFTVLLHKYSGQHEIVVGTPMAGRRRAELQEIVGMFINMLPMRHIVGEELSFHDFLENTKANALKAFENQDYQFDELVEELSLDRNLSRNPLFDVAFDFQNMELFDLEIEGVKFTPHRFDTNTSAYDLILTCQQSQGRNTIDAVLTFSSQLFTRATAERMQQHFVAILQQATSNARIAVADIDILSREEQDQVLYRFNETDLEYDGTTTIQELFEATSARVPEKVALVTGNAEYTYTELNGRANRLAHFLRSIGVGSNTIVGVLVERDVRLFVSMLAVLKAGAAYVLLDSQFPRERLNYMMGESDLMALVTETQFLSQASGFAGKIVNVDDVALEGALANPVRMNDSNDMCWIVYTSGSTGLPKGVVTTHRAALNFIADVKTRQLFETNDRIIAVTTVSFDIFAFESIVPLCLGHSIYLADKNEQLDPHLVNQAILRSGVTHILSTVTRIKAFVDNPGFLEALKRLKCILSGGEDYPVQLLETLKRQSTAKIYNMYGPTETTVWSLAKELTTSRAITIGKPIANTRAYVLGKQLRPQPVGVYGELCIGGDGVARGYWKASDLTAAKFVKVDWDNNQVVYRTGDRARWLPSGEIELKGRLDDQIKIRGYRIEPREIEQAALTLAGVSDAAVVAFDDANENKYLNLYYCYRPDCDGAVSIQQLKNHLQQTLPHYMIPANVVHLDQMPYLPNGKLNKNGLRKAPAEGPAAPRNSIAPVGDLEKSIAGIWRDVLKVEQVGRRDSFFELGGNSLGLILVSNKLGTLIGRPVALVDLFRYPTIESLVEYLQGGERKNLVQQTWRAPQLHSDIAIIAMEGRFPAARNVDEFWTMLATGVEGISSFTVDELIGSGASPEHLSQANYVRAKGIITETEFFDADFFGYSPREADCMDPQSRLLHQCAWETLEQAGYDPSSCDSAIGLFAGSSSNLAWMTRFFGQGADTLKAFEAVTLNEKDFLTTRISYKLGLTGPSYSVQTACSTSLVAIHQACQSLIKGECKMALAGGVSISLPKREGYTYQDGMVFSKDGHCHPFDERSTGTVPGNGYGLVLLKRLDDAVRDGDTIYAVIKGSAINNDGLRKVGYTAPSVDGQADVVREAMRVANISPETITFVEAHGTGTSLGDPIEIEALKKAYSTTKKSYCYVGSVKANIGHLDTAAGVAGLMKAALSLHHKTIPPQINFSGFNPRIDIGDSPFLVSTTSIDCSQNRLPLRAGVSSFGIGGTNAHMVLEEAPARGASGAEGANELLVFSARTARSVESTAQRVLAHVAAHPELKLSDVAYTLQVGRKAFAYRKTLVVDRALVADAEKAQAAVASAKTYGVRDGQRPVYFLFPGQGSQYAGMGRGLYEAGGVYREAVDRCLAALTESERDTLWSVWSDDGEGEVIHETEHSQLALFILEYALAQMLESLGVVADGMLGHSLGELVAATLAGVFTVEDGVRLVRRRGALMQAQPRGAMVAVLAGEAAVRASLIEGVWLAVVNTSENCIVSGSEERIAAYEEILTAEGTPWRRLKTSHAFHSPLMEEAAEKFAAEVELVPRGPARRPFVSNVSGEWIGEEARSGRYWGEHLRQPVQFAKGLGELLRAPDAVLIEVGPGPSLSGFAQQHGGRQAGQRCMALVRHPKDTSSDMEYLQGKLGRLWSEGVEIDWRAAHAGHLRHRVPLPTYDFEKQVFTDDIRLGQMMATQYADVEMVHRVGDSTPQAGSTDGSIESTLIRLWQDVLGVEHIVVDDNFFQIGGHSLTAVSLTSLIHKEMRVELPVTEIFNRPTIRELAAYLKQQKSLGRYERVTVVPEAAWYPVSSAQRRMYAMNCITGPSVVYNLHTFYVVDGRFDVDCLRSVVNQLVDRHESFRTSFELREGEAVQVVRHDIGDIFEYREKCDGTIVDACTSFLRPFDLSRAPLVRIGATALAPDQFLLMIDMHHIISDQTSMGVLVSEFADLYSGSQLEKLPIQYKDFAAWQNNYLRSESAIQQLDYWLREFDGDIPALDLPTDYPRTNEQQFEGDSAEFRFGEELTKRIKAFAIEQGLTPYMVMVGALDLVLWANSGQHDVVIGTATAGRRHADVEKVVGMFVNTLAIRIAIDPQMTVRAFLLHVKEKLLKGQENQDCPFELLVQRLNPAQDPSRNPIFDVMINYLNIGTNELSMPGLRLTPCAIKSGISKFDLTWTIFENSGEFVADLEYCTRLFTLDTVQAMRNQFLTILDQLARHPEASIDALAFISPEEKTRLLVEDNNTATVYPRDCTLAQLFEEQVEQFPGNIALTFDNDSMTYTELNQWANRIAWSLLKDGPRLKTMVGLVAEPSFAQIAGILGILKAGAAYIAIEPDMPSERMRGILEDSGATIIVAQAQFATLLQPYGDLLLLDNPSSLDDCTSNPPHLASATDCAYVTYTSGSTGKPKGTLSSHRNAIRVIRNTNYLKIQEDDVILQLATYAFDASILHIFGALLNGARLVLIRKKDTIDLSSLGAVITTERVSLFYITTALFNMIVEVDVDMLKGVRKVLIGGDRLSVPHVRRALARLGPGRLINAYGPTEITVFATYFDIDELSDNANSVPIGKAISNTTLYVLNRQNHLVPVGMPGELCVGGNGVAAGYLNESGMTAEKFVENPFEPGTKMYRTGDVVRRLSNGNLDFLGRTDFQVKIRGFRVELGEIEEQIRRVDGVRDGAVLVYEDTNGNKRLVAFFTADHLQYAAEVRRALQNRLPEYMIPEQFIQLDVFPFNANRKIDRKALWELGSSSKAGHTAQIERPSDDVERRVMQAMQAVLSVNHFGRDDDFFELGGHSLKAIALVQALAQQGVNLRVNDVFQCRTVARMATLASRRGPGPGLAKIAQATELEQLLQSEFGSSGRLITLNAGLGDGSVLVLNSNSVSARLKRVIAERVHPDLYPSHVIAGSKTFKRLGNQTQDELSRKDSFIRLRKTRSDSVPVIVHAHTTRQKLLESAILTTSVRTEFPLTAIQVGHLAVGSGRAGLAYDIPYLSDENALKHTIATLINRNQLLRCVLKADATERCWKEHGEITGAMVPFVDLSRYEPAHQQAILAELAQRVFDEPYEPGRLPHRPLCIQLNWHKAVLYWGMDHTVFDGMSSEIVKRQFETLYPARLAGQPAALAEAQRYSDYAAQLQRGPINVAEEEILSKYRLGAFSMALKECLKVVHHTESEDSEFELSVPLSSIPDGDVWTYAFQAAYRWLRDYTRLNEIPMSIVQFGRRYAGQDFFDCVGECLDIIPALTAGNASAILDLIAYSSSHNINFLALSLDPVLKRSYRNAAECLSVELDENQVLPLVLYNFQGKISAAEASTWTRRAAHQNLAAVVITAYYDEKQLFISASASRGVESSTLKPPSSSSSVASLAAAVTLSGR